MAVRTVDPIVARPVPATPPTVIPITPRQQKRLKLMDAIVEAGCEIIALGASALRFLADSREPDRAHDLSIIAVRRLAIKGADDSAAVHACPCWLTFQQINGHALEAQRHDLAEDWLIVRAFAAVARICEIGRGLNRALTRELMKRGAALRKARP